MAGRHERSEFEQEMVRVRGNLIVAACKARATLNYIAELESNVHRAFNLAVAEIEQGRMMRMAMSLPPPIPELPDRIKNMIEKNRSEASSLDPNHGPMAPPPPPPPRETAGSSSSDPSRAPQTPRTRGPPANPTTRTNPQDGNVAKKQKNEAAMTKSNYGLVPSSGGEWQADQSKVKQKRKSPKPPASPPPLSVKPRNPQEADTWETVVIEPEQELPNLVDYDVGDWDQAWQEEFEKELRRHAALHPEQPKSDSSVGPSPVSAPVVFAPQTPPPAASSTNIAG